MKSFIKKCQCGGTDIVPHHLIDGCNFRLWLQCNHCQTTSYAFQTLLDSIRGWNNGKIIKNEK